VVALLERNGEMVLQPVGATVALTLKTVSPGTSVSRATDGTVHVDRGKAQQREQEHEHQDAPRTLGAADAARLARAKARRSPEHTRERDRTRDRD
jgi:hypothetical protein